MHRWIATSIFKERFHEPLGFEALKVLDLFADSNIFYRNPEFLLNADNHPAFGGAIQFRQHNAIDIGGFFKNPRLLQAVLAGGRVQYQESLMRRIHLLARDNAANLFELFE